MKKLRTLAVIIAGLWCCSTRSATTDNYPDNASGYTDNGLLWTYTEDSFSAHLYIDGDGEMDNYSSTSPSPWAQYLRYVSDIVIGEGITTIGDYAFNYSNAKLKNISIPTTVTSIGQRAFSGGICETVPLVVIPEGVTTIGAYAFYNIGSRNNKSATVVLPSTLRTIGDHAFYCSAGTEDDSYRITVYSLASTPPSISGETFCIDDNEDATVYCPNPSAYSEWLGGAYLGGDGKSMPFSSYGITGNQFWGYNNGTLSLYPSDGKVSGYNNINMNNVSSVKINGYVTSVAESAFLGYIKLKSITIPSPVTEIGNNAFNGCISLKTATVPDGLLSIGEKAFSGCQSLTSFTIPGSVVGVSTNAFEGCYFARDNFVNNSIYVNEYTSGATIFLGEEYDGLFMYGNSDVTGGRPQLTNVTIPESAICIRENAFKFCTKLTDITLPSSMKIIYGGALSYCTALTNIYFKSNPSVPENDLPSSAITHLSLSDAEATDFYAYYANTYADVTYERNLPAGKYGTITLPFTPDAESTGNFIFYQLSSANERELMFDEVAQPQANTPYLYTLREGKSATQITGGQTTIASTINNPETVNNMQMIGSFTNQTIVTGEDASNYYYAYTSADNKLHKILQELTVKPYRAYFKNPAMTTFEVSSYSVYLRGANGIQKISIDDIEDFNDILYDLSGRPATNPVKGNIYIKNGKKLIY